MSLARIKIEQQMAAIGINQTRSQLSITSSHPHMRIEGNKEEPKTEGRPPELKVNWKQLNGDQGSQSPADMTLNVREGAKIQVTEYVTSSDITGGGNGKTPAKGGIRQETQNISEKPTVNTEKIATKTQAPPKVSWDPDAIDVNWSNHQFKIQWEGEYMPEVKLEPPYSVEIFLRNKPFLRISVEELQDAVYA